MSPSSSDLSATNDVHLPLPDPASVVAFARSALGALADPAKARDMAAYMKTDLPFFGVQKPDRVPIQRAIKQGFKPQDTEAYEAAVLALWAEPEREMKYLAIFVASTYKAFILPAALPLYARLIREGAWWDLVDGVTGEVVTQVLDKHRAEVRPVMDAWVEDEDMWIRRAALISQVGLKQATDEAQLFDYCLRRADEKEFFIRKAIGWALRDYSWTAPGVVHRFLLDNRERLSSLSYREGAKHLARLGMI